MYKKETISLINKAAADKKCHLYAIVMDTDFELRNVDVILFSKGRGVGEYFDGTTEVRTHGITEMTQEDVRCLM